MKKDNGFTLIEILLVLTMMAVVSALIAPSFFSAAGSTVASEARQLQKILRMVSEESQLSGMPIQLRVYHDHLTFYTPDQEKKWQPLTNEVLQTYTLGSPILIAQAQLDGDAGIMINDQNNDKQNNTPPSLARFLFWPDGSVTAGEITLKTASKSIPLTIRIDAGAAGIRVIKP